MHVKFKNDGYLWFEWCECICCLFLRKASYAGITVSINFIRGITSISFSGDICHQKILVSVPNFMPPNIILGGGIFAESVRFRSGHITYNVDTKAYQMENIFLE